MSEKKKKKKTSKQTALEIYVGEEKMSVARTVQAQIRLLAMPTPEKYIMKREARGGVIVDYVETNYVIGRLNATFFFNWDTEIIEQIIDRDNNEIALKIRLTVRFANGKEIKKDAWGGSAIKFSGTKMIDLADDLKSAESDGIKKAASMLGICWDVYAGLTSSIKKKKATKDDSDDGFTDMSGAPDARTEFRIIPLTINKKTIMHTKYEALDRFKKAKEKLGKELYYKILGEHGYEKSNQLPNDDIPKLYYAMIAAFEQMEIKQPEPEKESETEQPEPEKESETSTEFSTKEKVLFPDDEEKKPESPVDEKEELRPEMPLQKDVLALARLESKLVDSYGFKAKTIVEKLEKKFGEANLSKLTKKQTEDAIKYFEETIETLEKKKFTK